MTDFAIGISDRNPLCPLAYNRQRPHFGLQGVDHARLLVGPDRFFGRGDSNRESLDELVLERRVEVIARDPVLA